VHIHMFRIQVWLVVDQACRVVLLNPVAHCNVIAAIERFVAQRPPTFVRTVIRFMDRTRT
jgi:hypothetical protein